jgi:phosphatidylglycerol:prolipoprotein diacylglycerol transferase
MRKIDALSYLDAIAPYIGLAVFFGRIGCYIRGCCIGLHTTLFLQGRHPWQLYDAANGLLTLIILSRWKRRFKGELFAVYVASYSSIRFLLEYLRDDYRVGWLTYSQLAYGMFALIAMIYIGFKRRNQKK